MLFVVGAIVATIVSCQPKTVVVERVDGELVPVAEQIGPQILVIDERTTVWIGQYKYDVYTLVDLKAGRICRALNYGTSLGLSCWAATDEEWERYMP